MVGYFDGITSTLIQTGADGRRYHAPFGKLGRIYSIPDENASERIQSRWKNFFLTLFGLTIVSTFLTHDWRIMIILALVEALLTVPFSYWAARELPPANITYAELPTITKAQAVSAYSQAIGRRTAGIILGASVLMTLLSIAAVFVNGGIMPWLATVIFTVCTVSNYLTFRRAR